MADTREALAALLIDYSIACGELSKGLPADDPMWDELRDLGERLSAALATQPAAQPSAQGEAVAWIRQDWSGSGQRTLSFEGPPDPKPLRDEVVNPIWTPLYASAPAAPAQAVPLTAAADLVSAMWDEFKSAHPSYRTSYEEGYLDALDFAEQRIRARGIAPKAAQP